jgi:hypothetical protein
MAADRGIPQMYLRDYAEVYKTPSWNWGYQHEIDGILYTHGTGTSGLNPAFNSAKGRLQSCVQGHHHSLATISWIAGPTTRLFGMCVGSGVDKNHKAMSYGKHFIRKPIVSCGVVIDGHPYLELLDM